MQSDAITVQSEITPHPVRVGRSTITIQLKDAASRPLDHASISVEGDMDHPGMAPVFSDAKEASAGSYDAPIDFTMGGDWVVLLHIKLADGRKIERQMDVKGVRSN